jgi:hypothetical protein
MAFMKTAKAEVQDGDVEADDWNRMKMSAMNQGSGFVKGASSIDMNKYTPEDYLLSHCTIIASVDVDEVSDVKTGEDIRIGGNETINRPYNDYYITPDTSRFVNQNNDAWERDLLLDCYDSFIGSENYVEHVQVPELSKGKVIDAVARDLGDSVYVDILVATNKKHGGLVQDIKKGKINKLSMGCSISFSICSKCGNKAVDETDLCHHVKHMKGDTFTDEEGNERIISELCGHKSEPDSVKFIEASWVVDPAFDGAVLRKVLGEEEKREYEDSSKTDSLSDMIEQSHEISMARQTSQAGSSLDAFFKSAHLHGEPKSIQEKYSNWGDDDEDDEDDGGEDKSDVEKAVNKIKEYISEEASEQVLEEAGGKGDMAETSWEDTPEPMSEDSNMNLLSSYTSFQDKYGSEFSDKRRSIRAFLTLHQANQNGWHSLRHSSSVDNQDIVSAMYLRDRDLRENTLPRDMYRCLQKVGGTQNYRRVEAFLNACELALDRPLNKNEKKVLIRRAKSLK